MRNMEANDLKEIARFYALVKSYLKLIRISNGTHANRQGNSKA